MNLHELVFVLSDGEASSLLLPSLVSILSGSILQPENIFLHPQVACHI